MVVTFILKVMGTGGMRKEYGNRMKCGGSVQRITKAGQNPKRIMTQWNRIWGVLDYGNNYKEELHMLYSKKEV